MFAESLTVRILADSSGFRSDVDNVLSLLDRLKQSVQAVAEGGATLAGSLAQASRALGPLQQVSKLLAGIHSQMRAIAQTPLTINVGPAIASLAQLAGMIDAVAAKLSALSAAGGAPAVGPSGGGPGLPPNGFNPYVGNPLPGLPGKLSAAAFPHVAAIPTTDPRSPASISNASTTNNYGGITIQVRETADVNGLMRDLRFQGIHLRNRRG
jgi:hypothetical protein